jgi:hypothetical protein
VVTLAVVTVEVLLKDHEDALGEAEHLRRELEEDRLAATAAETLVIQWQRRRRICARSVKVWVAQKSFLPFCRVPSMVVAQY